MLALVLGLVVAAVVLILLVWWHVPIVVDLVGLLVATIAFVVRLLGVVAWTIRARGGEHTLSWSVKGTFRSTRAMREVAAKLARGEQATFDCI